MPLVRNFVLTGSSGRRAALLAPDIGICAACAAEIAEPKNRRYRYAFTNCKDCGPRFTLVRPLSDDCSAPRRAQFRQCPHCRQEYEDPEDRRFQAEPNACPFCGPNLYYYRAGERPEGDPYALFDKDIKEGKIVAVKGIGGYHLVCDAQNGEAVARLRKNKVREDKPFAVMMRDLGTVQRFCHLDVVEESLLSSARKPIVLLKKRENCPIAEETAPRNGRLGVMLPYTPLHLILMRNYDVLVMTSANTSDRPMIFDDREALDSLWAIADAVLTHDRPIFRRMDDSVSLVVAGKARMLRRSRGYVPEPIKLSGNSRVLLALGAQQKNTFCLVKGEEAFLSGHIGDLDDLETEEFYAAEIDAYLRLFNTQPEMIVCDRHPDYVSTRYAQRFKDQLPIYQIQHHHAHFASVLAEHELENNVIGLVFDGTGYGEDGTIWGGEALWGGISESRRIGHLLPAPLFGGAVAIREPWRMALAMLRISCGEGAALDYFEEYGDQAKLLLRAGERGLNSPLTSSAGRLFDAAAALAGIRAHTTFEGQAAIELEQVIDDSAAGSYGLDVVWQSDRMIFDWRQLICDLVRDVRRGYSRGEIAVKFHRAIVQLLVDAALLAKQQYGSSKLALSGGVFQNAYLLHHGLSKLERCGFKVYTNERVPTNDGGISYGQAAVGARLAEAEMG
ncbi:MAG: carbamoyltransferase HypF [Firmicutes bacterium]|nr:carbamoyltransferase HypF [Bacillota bacterium]